MPDFASILIVDDDESVRNALRSVLEKFDYDCVFAQNGVEALAYLIKTPFDLVVTDLAMPQMDGLTLLARIQEMPTSPTVVVLTGHTEIHMALDASHRGAFDYIVKPFSKDQLLLSIARALEHHRLLRLGERLSRQIANTPTYAGLIGQSAPMLELFRLIAQAAPTNATVLITGESGTGKEKVARALHNNSQRRSQSFNVVDCAAIPETLMESSLFGHKAGAFTGATAESPGILGYSNGGTVFFDEIGELPLALQPKLLRVLQERSYTPVGAAKPVSVDVRILAATNRDLEEEIHQGRFREDLYYRINVLNLQVPPLRERGDDAIGLARYFFAELSPNYPHVNEIAPEAFECLRRYAWPGNVRELRNTMERAMATTPNDTIGVTDLPVAVRNALFSTAPPEFQSPASNTPPPLSALAALGSLENVQRHVQQHYLREVLTQYKGNVAHASQHANISRKTFYKLMDDLNLNPEDFRV